MSTSLMLMAMLLTAPQPTNELALADVRLTHGVAGPTRLVPAVLPGDRVTLSFDIVGITTDDQGKALYSICTEISDENAKVLFRQPGVDQDSILPLGGGRLPAFAQVDVGVNQPAGKYSLKVTVKDRANGKSVVLERTIVVVAKAFGLVRFSGSRDPDNQLPSFLPVAGQTIWMHMTAVGFERDKATGQPNVTLEVRILDDKKQPTVKTPFKATINKDVAENLAAIPLQFPLLLNRAGNFTLEIKAMDQVAGKRIEFVAPFTILGHR